MQNPSIIIIGAGAAGIAAATRLYKNGIENITILEAENRIGGRIYSVKFQDNYLDLGAQWCHGEKNNVVYDLTKDLNILRPTVDWMPKLYHSNLKLLDATFTQKVVEIFLGIYMEDKPGYKKSVGEYALTRFQESIVKQWVKDDKKLILAEECMDVILKGISMYEGAFSCFNVFADSDFEVCEGNHLLGWNGHGYKTIFDVLMQKHTESKNAIPIDDKVILNKEVSTIIWDNNESNFQKAVINCVDRSSYTADHVILTTSLGVLKERQESFFQPPLPSDKVNAIEELGMDGIIKMFLHFPQKWWDGCDFTGCCFVWSSEDLAKTAQSFPDGPKRNGKSWISSILLIVPVAKNPNVLEMRLAGEFVPEIELCSEETIVNGIMYVLNKFLGQQYSNISRPDSVIWNKWYTNPHFRGAYSYQTVKSKEENLSKEIVLSQPLTTKMGKQTLLFAGEATSPTYYSTVHGAIESGFREADRLIAIYK